MEANAVKNKNGSAQFSEKYAQLVNEVSPKSKTARDTFRAFICGGAICCVGQLVYEAIGPLKLPDTDRSCLTTVIMIALGVLFTALHLYSKFAKFAGAGTMVPVTGFANSVAASAIEFKSEGLVTGMSTKMFIIAGPVIVFGLAASVLYGIILAIFS